MNPIPIPPAVILQAPQSKQVRMTPPPDYDKIHGMEDCGVLDILVLPKDEDYGVWRLISWWEPDEEERAAIAEGKPIRLTFFGADGLPPIALGVETGEGVL